MVVWRGNVWDGVGMGIAEARPEPVRSHPPCCVSGPENWEDLMRCRERSETVKQHKKFRSKKHTLSIAKTFWSIVIYIFTILTVLPFPTANKDRHARPKRIQTFFLGGRRVCVSLPNESSELTAAGPASDQP